MRPTIPSLAPIAAAALLCACATPPGGGATQGLLARRMFANEQFDLFITAPMDATGLEHAWAGTGAESQAMVRGAAVGYERYLADHAGKLPAACNDQPWVRPMSLAEFRRRNELTMVQAATAALGNAVLGAKAGDGQGGHRDDRGRHRRRHAGDARGRPARGAAGLQHLGLRQGHDGQRQRAAARMPLSRSCPMSTPGSGSAARRAIPRRHCSVGPGSLSSTVRSRTRQAARSALASAGADPDRTHADPAAQRPGANSNDSFYYTNPQQKWSGMSPLVRDASLTRPRRRV